MGQDTYKAGYGLAQMCDRKLSLKPSDRVMVWGVLSYESKRKLRTAGSIDFFKKAGIQAAGYDLSEGAVQGIKDGYISMVNDQQPFLQGYLPVLQVCLTRKYGFGGLHINTDSSFVDESNVDFFASLVKQKIR